MKIQICEIITHKSVRRDGKKDRPQKKNINTDEVESLATKVFHKIDITDYIYEYYIENKQKASRDK